MILCVICPGFDQVDILEKYGCATCLEMPDIWENLRKCDFKYEFFNNAQGIENNLFNYSMKIYDIYSIIYTDVYKVSKMIQKCQTYTWVQIDIT